MTAYIIKRILIGIGTLLVLVTVTFFLTRLMPGNPFETDNLSGEVLDQLMAQYKLDRPLGEQYTSYLSSIFSGDFGVSFKKSGVSVNDLIIRGAAVTMKLGLIAFGVALVVGVALGIWQAVTRSEVVRGLLLAFSTLGVSVPNYVLALLLLLVFGVKLQLLPVLGLDTPAHYILPVTTMAVYPIAMFSRLVKNSFGEALTQDYVTLAKAKGLRRPVILLRHVLKNAVLPVITSSGPTIAFLLTGSFVVENLFTIPGIGKEFVNAISNRDYTVIMGLTIFVGAFIIIATLITDIISCVVDPRIKISD